MGRGRLTEKQRELRKLTREIRVLTRDINHIIDKHNGYEIGGVEDWFDCYPIESLRESLNYDHGNRRSKFSLQDFLKKIKLRRQHQEKMDKLEDVSRKQSIAEIDVILERINRLL